MATIPKPAGDALAGSLARARDTPMLRQYFEMKGKAPDAILFYRMGDFYEMFFEDAKEAAPILGIALTARNRDSDIEAPMCGVPWQSAGHHIAKLIASGRKVAICDQVEDPRAAKGIVRRDVTRVITPGTVLDPESLSPAVASWLAVVVPGTAGGTAKEEPGVALLDFSTGQFLAGTVPAHRLGDLVALFRPREILVAEDSAIALPRGASVSRRPAAWFLRASESVTAARDGVAGRGAAAAATARAYAVEMRPGGAGHVGEPAPLHFGERMVLDPSAIATLE